FDIKLLPPNARTVGTPEFREAVNSYLKKEFSGFGGSARIVVSDDVIGVRWDTEPKRFEPLEIAVGKLNRGQYREGVQLLELLRSKTPHDPAVLYNLGMALSDLGELDRAVGHLRTLVSVAPDHTNGRVALGVALARQNKTEEAIRELQEALKDEPDNPFALRNLGACLLKSGSVEPAEEHLRRAVEISPEDQQAWFGLAEAVHGLGKAEEADDLYRKAVDIDPSSDLAEVARQRLSGIAQATFRGKTPGMERMDAVMYLLGALEKFEAMSTQEIQTIGFEVATLGMKGFDVNDSSQKYTIRSLPGRFSGLHMVCLMYAAFQIISPNQDVGFDLSKEYALALEMKRERGR
ncbi:MAG TPA: tetratricopeptide repeat protein, partial [Isosphaeraceae bacterium]|nr:tetratricopeptide repeat protein [Isosphaeraceae bacterium]